MAKKLKTYKTPLGSFDLTIAARGGGDPS
jgi:hypothetical protein